MPAQRGQAPSQARRFTRKAVAGDGRDDDIKCVLRFTAISSRICKRADRLDELEGRTRPTMGQNDRKGVGMTRPHMDELDIDPVDRCDEFRKCIELSLGLAPVVISAPVTDQILTRES